MARRTTITLAAYLAAFETWFSACAEAGAPSTKRIATYRPEWQRALDAIGDRLPAEGTITDMYLGRRRRS